MRCSQVIAEAGSKDLRLSTSLAKYFAIKFRNEESLINRVKALEKVRAYNS